MSKYYDPKQLPKEPIKIIIGGKRSGKTLQSLINYVRNITPVDKYTLYIKEELFDQYIGILDKYIPTNVEVCRSNDLPKNIYAVYTKNIDVYALLKGSEE